MMNPFAFLALLGLIREQHRGGGTPPIIVAPPFPPTYPPPGMPPGTPPIIVEPPDFPPPRPPGRPPSAPPRQPPPPDVPPDWPPPDDIPPDMPPGIPPPDFPPPTDMPPGVPPPRPPPDVPPDLPPGIPPGVPPAPPTPGTKGRPTIRQGSRGPDVVDWQEIIRVKADGIFGAGTHAATVAWQRARPPLVADGIVGPATWARGIADPRTPPPDMPIPPRVPPPQTTGRPTIRQGSPKSQHVIDWQRIVGVKADGIFGAGTRTATIAWQKERGLAADGVVGPATWTRAAAGDMKPPPIFTIPKPDVSSPPPWPQKVPTDLPAFPGGWTPDQPPPQAVQARAKQLLPTLWAKGQAGVRKVEKTTGRWITYKGEAVGPKKAKGVVAYRLKNPSGVSV